MICALIRSHLSQLIAVMSHIISVTLEKRAHDLGERLVKLFLYSLGAIFVVGVVDLLAPDAAWSACSTTTPPNGSTVVCTAEGEQNTRVGAGRGNNDVGLPPRGDPGSMLVDGVC